MSEVVKKRNPWKIAVIVVGVLILLAAIGKSAKRGEGKSDTPIASQVNAVPPAPEAAQVTPPPVAKEKEWVMIATASGEGNKATAPFVIVNAPTRLRYKVDGGQFPMFAAYVMKDGASLEQGGGVPLVMVTKSAQDETRIMKPAGTYYLDVKAANTKWAVFIDQERDRN